jgi:hypothetical protein
LRGGGAYDAVADGGGGGGGVGSLFDFCQKITPPMRRRSTTAMA